MAVDVQLGDVKLSPQVTVKNISIKDSVKIGNIGVPIIGGGGVVVDSELSTTSKNPVQNKVITNTIDDIQDDVLGKLGDEDVYELSNKELEELLK